MEGGETESHKAEHTPKHERHIHAEKRGMQRYQKYIIASVIYLLIALVMFYAITSNITTVAPGTGADTYQNLWDIWWVNYAVFQAHTNAFFTRILFWPIGANLAYVTLSPLLGILSAPLQAVSTTFAYNVMFFLGFTLSGLTMFILAYYLTNNGYAALVSGMVFSFSAFHIAQSYSHIHFMNIEWIPLFVYFFLKVVDSSKAEYGGKDFPIAEENLKERHELGFRIPFIDFDVLGMSACFALTTLMGNIEQTLMLTLGFIFLVIIFLFYKDRRSKILTRRFAIAMIIFLLFAFIIGSWNFIPLIKAVASPGGLGIANFQNNAQENQLWSVSPLAFFVPSYYNGLFYGIVGNSSKLFSIYQADPVERVAYVGYAVLLLSLLAIYKNWKKMLPWAVGALIFAWLALGPAFLLYGAYSHIPLLSVVREPGRFDLMATMFFAILAAYGAKELFDYLAKGHHNPNNNTKIIAAAFIIILLMFIENNGMPLNAPLAFTTKIQIPQLYYELSKTPGNFSVMGLPTLPTVGTSNPYLYPGEDTFYTSITHKSLVGGYVGGRQNTTSTLLLYNVPLAVESTSLAINGSVNYPSPVNQNFTNQTILSLYNYGTEFIILHKDAYPQQQQYYSILSYLVDTFGNPVYNDNTTMAFQTLNTMNKSIFKSFVAYPVLTQWSPVSILLNGTNQQFWVPVSYGSIVVYAPYASNSILRQGNISFINGSISFVAASNEAQKLYIAEPVQGNTTRTLAAINVTTRPQKYIINATFVSGPFGNEFYFAYGNGNQPVLINNITFSK